MRQVIISIVAAAVLAVGCLSATVYSQATAPPVADNIGSMKKIVEVGFADVWYPDANTLGVQVATADATPAFNVRIWIQYKGQTSRRFYEKRIAAVAVDPKSPLEVVFKGLSNLVGSEIGMFIDSKKEIPEKDEKNCVRITATREWIVGLSCTNFGKEK